MGVNKVGTVYTQDALVSGDHDHPLQGFIQRVGGPGILSTPSLNFPSPEILKIVMVSLLSAC